jgi:hypothetical protein
VEYVIYKLGKRLNSNNWLVALKALMVFHRLMRECDPGFQEQVGVTGVVDYVCLCGGREGGGERHAGGQQKWGEDGHHGKGVPGAGGWPRGVGEKEQAGGTVGARCASVCRVVGGCWEEGAGKGWGADQEQMGACKRSSISWAGLQEQVEYNSSSCKECGQGS